MNTATYPARMQFSAESLTEETFTLHDEIPADPDGVQLDFSFLEIIESVVASGFFEALVRLRAKLESENIWLCCNGAVEYVYPTAMARSMGGSLKAY